MWVQTLIQNQKGEDESLTQNPVPSLLPPSSSLVNQTSQKKENTSSIHRCGEKETHCTSSWIAVAKRNSSQQRSSSDLPCRQHRTHNPTPLDGSTKEAIYASSNSVDYSTTSRPSKMRYCVMFLLSKFVMFFWANIVYGNIMLYMSLGHVVLLLL
jgi:hypothetical protein